MLYGKIQLPYNEQGVRRIHTLVIGRSSAVFPISHLESDSEQFICHTTTKNPYTCNQNIQIHYIICCADQDTCIKINVDRYHAGHQLEKKQKTIIRIIAQYTRGRIL